VDSIWGALANILYHKIVFNEIEKDKQLKLLDDALATLRLLNGANDADIYRT